MAPVVNLPVGTSGSCKGALLAGAKMKDDSQVRYLQNSLGMFKRRQDRLQMEMNQAERDVEALQQRILTVQSRGKEP
jgi:predicted  nucleic acid-binding Zn-ribbon protein